MKQCNFCKMTLDFSMFFRDKRNKTDGHYSICKSCKTKKTIEWRRKNPDKYNSGMRAYNKIHYQRLRLQRYKLDPNIYIQMLKDQKGLCAICQRPPNGKRPLAIDHCHKNGNVRGLLCNGCNRAISILEKPTLFKRAITYLNK